MILQTKHLTITHNRDLKDLIRDLNLTVEVSDKLTIIGEEGNGKSTLLNFLMEPELIQDYASISGEVHRHFSRYAYLPQLLPIDDAKKSLNDYFFGDLEVDLDYALLYRLAQELHFESDRLASEQILATLSGGERLKVQLIKQLAQPYEILFLDEPSNDLDLDTLIWLQNFIATSPATVIYISHDPTFLAATATRILHLELLKKKREPRATIANIGYEDYIKERQLNFDKASKQARKDAEEHEKKLARHQRLQQSVQHALRQAHDSTQGRLLAKKMKTVLSQGKRYEKEASQLTQMPDQESQIALFFEEIESLPPNKILVDLKNWELERAGKILAQNIHFQLKGQEKIGLIGTNGIGKTTFLTEVRKILSQRTDLRLAFMPQNYDQELPLQKLPLDFLAPSGDMYDLEKARTHLASLNFRREEIEHEIKHLSGGQKAKLLLLKLVLDKANVLLLDEPTRNLSPLSHPEITQLFCNFPGAIFCVSHDRSFLKQVCDKVYELTERGLEEVVREKLL